MNIAKHICIYGLLVVSLLSGCDTTEESFPLKESSYRIGMSVSTDVTRALISSSDRLQKACTPLDAGGDGEAISVWGDNIFEGVRETVFQETPLYYDETVGKNDEVNGINWNYADEKKWVPGALYMFRAAFPTAEIQKYQSKNVNAEQLYLQNFNTQTSQVDMMVAATVIDTEANPEKMSIPVPLQFRHIMAGINFTVKWTADYNEKITSCYLKNVSEGKGLATVGNMVYTGYNNSNEAIEWNTQFKIPTPIYEWKTDGVRLSISNEVVLYSKPNGVAIEKGELFTDNDGWLLVIPQKVIVNELIFYYTLETTGDHLYSVAIPPITYTPGSLYKYVLELGGSDVSITLTIADWNERNATFNIEL